MLSDLMYSGPAPSPTKTESDVRRRMASCTTDSAAIDEGEWRRVNSEDEYQRVFVELNSAFYADYGRALDAASWAGLSRFLKRTSMRVRPTMGAESTGRVIATWRIGDEALTLEFIDKFKLKFAVTAKSANALERRWGLGHAVSLLDAEPLAARFVV